MVSQLHWVEKHMSGQDILVVLSLESQVYSNLKIKIQVITIKEDRNKSVIYLS